MQTGYFYHYRKNAGPSEGGISTKIHLEENGKPVCGARLHAESRFSYCSADIHYPYIDCCRCKKIAAEILDKRRRQHDEKEMKKAARGRSISKSLAANHKAALDRVKELEEELEYMISPGYNNDEGYRAAARKLMGVEEEE
jgi:hypothetical protein